MKEKLNGVSRLELKTGLQGTVVLSLFFITDNKQLDISDKVEDRESIFLFLFPDVVEFDFPSDKDKLIRWSPCQLILADNSRTDKSSPTLLSQ